MCGNADVTILLNPVNDPPEAFDDFLEAPAGEMIDVTVLDNDLPIESPYSEFYDIFDERDSIDAIEVIKVEAIGESKVVLENGTVMYTGAFSYVDQEDSFRYWIKDSGGLIDSAIVHVNVGPARFHIFEALSPNGDGDNDFWRINGIEQDPDNVVRIFDRFNNLVFETKGYTNENNHWVGQSNNGISHVSLPEGTYYYTINIDLVEDNEGGRLFSGYVVLKRK